MHTFRFIRLPLLLLLSAWLGGISDVHAGNAAAGDVAASRTLTRVPAAPAGAVQSVAKAVIQPADHGSQGRILFILASSRVHGTSLLPASISFGEVVHAWDTFQAAGYAVDFVSPDGGGVPILDEYVSEDVASRVEDENLMSGLRNTAKPEQVDPGRYRAVYYVGGSNAIYGVPEHPVLQNIAMQVYERNGGVISAVCHGTAGIVNLKLSGGPNLVAGKRITGFPEEHERQDAAYFKEFPFLIRKTVEARGGVFHALDSEAPYIEIDGRVVTGQNYASAKPVAEAVVDVLRTLSSQQPGSSAEG
ncbi:type 1 glutamine amidotransferase domain-containing protein [Stenotrophomonas sp. Iso1]|uniref:type 1 glutamine amidotransferase domain-containing protein n=1 Tax=Stenotrophomonas sp. Iso1 TaxID=2977283 RepID=UPI0022B7B0AA|nr:type 1 glutamine amidotransferase domain-containing protein [Stenotrophomonas sp. Iso1]